MRKRDRAAWLSCRTPTMTTPAHSAKSSANRIDVFLSHASEDLSAAHMLTEAIEQAGWSVFLAARDLPGVIDE